MRLKPVPIAIIILTILVLAFFHYQYGLFTRYNYITAQWDKRHNEIRLVTYGEELLANKQYKIIAQKMGFRWETIAGCLISSPSINGAEQYNKVMTEYLVQKIGNGWKKRFDKSVDSLFRLQSELRIRKAVMDENEVKELINTYDPRTLARTSVKMVNLTDTDSSHPNAQLLMQYQSKIYVLAYFRVNPYTLSVSRIVY
jgi:hypothetical protein